VKSFLKLGPKQRIIALHATFPTDQHMISTGNGVLRQNLAYEGAKTALHPVTDNSAADLFRNCNTYARHGITITAIVHQQHEARHGRALTAIRGQKIGAAGHKTQDAPGRALHASRDQAVSFLRPRARRAFSSLRPAAVAMRRRKPWRRLRTRLLG
jgi:hypothetical protein